MTKPSAKRIAPVLFPERWPLPGKPPAEAPATVQDCFRQTGFALAADLRLLEQGMNLQLQVVRDSSASRYRTPALAAGLMAWSRSFLALSDAAHAVTRGSYGSVAPLVRAACEYAAAAHQAQGEEQPAFQNWLSGALHPNVAHRAVELTLGPFFAGGALAAEADLGAVYRAASELARPHFGVSLLFSAPESNQQRLAVAFADQSFHLGLAQLTVGWLLRLCDVQLHLARAEGVPYAVAEETAGAYSPWQMAVERLLTATDRCWLEELREGGERRWLLHNVRRQPGGAPKRWLL